MTEKRKRGSRAYLDAFQKDREGNYIYTGKLYIWQGEESALRRRIVIAGALSAGMLFLAAAALCVDAPGTTGCVYVLFPAVLALPGSISVCWGVARLWAGGTSMREYVYQATMEKVPGRAAATGAMAAAAILGESIYLLKNGTGGRGTWAFLFVLCQACLLLGAIGIRKCLKGMEFKAREQEFRAEKGSVGNK